MVSPLSRSLAKQFILESGACDAETTTLPLAAAQAIGARIADIFCAGSNNVVACLRAIPASDLVAVRVQASILD